MSIDKEKFMSDGLQKEFNYRTVKTNRIHIDSDILMGALTRAGISVNDPVMSGSSLTEWMQGTKFPTLKQLEAFAQKVHIPLGYLFLDSLPVEETPIPFFRKGRQSNRFNLNVYDTVLMIQKRQEWLSEYLKANEFEVLSYVGAYRGQTVNEVVDALRNLLRLDADWAISCSDQRKALNKLTDSIEEVGVITSFNSIVGNNSHRKIEVDECRGFALVDKRAPFIFVNSGDCKAAQLFTLVHEMAHILIGFSAGYGVENIWKADSEEERLCDKVAAEFLVPQTLMNEDFWDVSQYTSVAKKYKVSILVIARRALDCGYITKEDFFNFYRSYKRQAIVIKKASNGGDFYLTAIKRISKTFVIHINNAVKSNQLLYRDAYMLTGLQGNTLNNLFQSQLG